MTCSCGTPLALDATFCSHCGRRVAVASPVPRHRWVEWVVGIFFLGVLGCGALSFMAEQSTASSTFTPGDRPSLTTRKVTYIVTGSGGEASLTYENATGNTEQTDSVRTPWSRTFIVQPGAFAYVSAQNQNDSGSMHCVIEIDDRPVEQADSNGAYTIATCSTRVP